jgi:hypothetical protein
MALSGATKVQAPQPMQRSDRAISLGEKASGERGIEPGPARPAKLRDALSDLFLGRMV